MGVSLGLRAHALAAATAPRAQVLTRPFLFALSNVAVRSVKVRLPLPRVLVRLDALPPAVHARARAGTGALARACMTLARPGTNVPRTDAQAPARTPARRHARACSLRTRAHAHTLARLLLPSRMQNMNYIYLYINCTKYKIIHINIKSAGLLLPPRDARGPCGLHPLRALASVGRAGTPRRQLGCRVCRVGYLPRSALRRCGS